MTVDGLLDAAPDLVDGLATELDDMERIEHRRCVGELVIASVLVAVGRVQRYHLPRWRSAVAADA